MLFRSADAFSEFSQQLQPDTVWFFEAQVDKSREQAGLIIERLISLEAAPRELSGSMLVKLEEERHDPAILDQLARLLRTRPGKSPVFLEISGAEGFKARLKVGDDFAVSCDQEFAGQVEGLVGAGCVLLAPGGGRTNGSNGNGNGQRRYGRPNR